MQTLMKQGILEIIKQKTRNMAQKEEKFHSKKLLSMTEWRHKEFEYLSCQTTISTTTLKRWFQNEQELREVNKQKILDFVAENSWDDFMTKGLLYHKSLFQTNP